MHEKLPVSVPQIRHESTAMAAFQNSNATDDGHALRLRQSPGRAFVNDGQFSGQGAGQQDGGKFSRTERMTRPQTGQFGDGGGWVNFNPIRARHRLGCCSAGPPHDNFLMHFAGNVDSPEELPQEVEAAKAGERDERGGIGNNNHSWRRSAVAWSSARSAAA